MKERKDKGQKRRHYDGTRNGKDTVTAFKRRRMVAVSVPLGSTEGDRTDRTVFGHEAMAAERLKELCKEVETDAFQKIARKATDKWEEKRKATAEAIRQGTGLALLAPAKRASVLRKDAARRALAQQSKIKGEFRLSWRCLVRDLSGAPLIFVEPGVGGLAGEFGGRPLREYVFGDTLPQYVVDPRVPQQRILLVKDLTAIPPAMLLAAWFLGARVQQHILTPALHLQPLRKYTVAATAAFVRAHRPVVQVLRAAAQRVPCIRSLSAPEFTREAAAAGEKARKARFTFLYHHSTDAELVAAPPAVQTVARSLNAFLQTCAPPLHA